MDDGYGYGGHRAGRPGHDIGPGEDRPRYFQGTPVDMLTVHENDQGGMEIEYQQVFVARQPGEMVYEPIDETPYDQSAETRRSTVYATDSQYYSEANRLETFRDMWLDDYHVRPRDLARDGFIHIGPGDKVKCVFCLKTLRNWEPGDSVEGEHRKHYPFCPFVKGECDLNIPINATENMKRSFGLKLKPAEEHSVHTMQDLSLRLQSFENWPKQAHIRPEALAEAGLYYSGIADKVTCFSCGQALGNWEPGDDPWHEHAKWSPHCPHVNSVKGSDYVKQIHEPVCGVNDSMEPASSVGQESNMGQESSTGQEINVGHMMGQENSMGQKSSTGQEINVGHTMAQESDRFKFTAASPAVKSSQLEVNTLPFQPHVNPLHALQTSSHGAKEPATEVEQEINSAPVKAVLETYDIPIAEMRKLLERIKISGDDNFRSEDVKSVLENYDIPVETLREMLQRVRIKKGGASPQPRTKDLEER